MLFKRQHIEYANKFQQIIDKNSEFAVTMLDLCTDQNEAEKILLNKMLPPGDEFLDSRLPFPILEAALINKCKKFVAHDYSQETLREKLVHSDVNDDILPWNSTSQTFQYLYILMSLILMPIFVIFKVLWDIAQLCRKGSKNNASQSEGRKPRLRFLYSFFSFPLNRSIGYLYSIILQFVFVLLWITGLDVMVWFVWIISLAGLIALLKKFW